jgi:hypothetical protein
MGQHAISGLAALAALAFLIMALAACASSEQPMPAHQDAFYKGNGVAEYHGAHIGADDLRDQLPSE